LQFAQSMHLPVSSMTLTNTHPAILISLSEEEWQFLGELFVNLTRDEFARIDAIIDSQYIPPLEAWEERGWLAGNVVPVSDSVSTP